MGDFARWLLVLVFVVGVWAAQRLFHYPGRWEHVFGRAHESLRQDVATARKHLARIERELRQEWTAATQQMAATEADGRSKTEALLAELRRIRQWDRGDELDRLGVLALHEHALVVRREDEADEPIPLHGLQTSLEGHAPGTCYLYLRPPGGKPTMLPFPTGEYDEGRVRAFALRIEQAVVDEDTFLEDRDARSAHLESELRRVKAETASALQSAQEERRKLEEEHLTNPQLETAREEWDDACGQWKKLTGRSPRRWARPPRRSATD